jgi:hypothetical protein
MVRRPISHVIVRLWGAIEALGLDAGTPIGPVYLGVGRYNCEGYIDRGQKRYVRLRKVEPRFADQLDLVEEWHLVHATGRRELSCTTGSNRSRTSG